MTSAYLAIPDVRYRWFVVSLPGAVSTLRPLQYSAGPSTAHLQFCLQ
jgi:hypothetical protein